VGEPGRDRRGLPPSIPAVLDRAASLFPRREALAGAGVRMSFSELAGAVDEVSRALVAGGIEPGDRVAIWAPNIPEWVLAALGVHRAGAVLVPVNTRFRGEEAAYVLRASGARVLITVSDFLSTNYVELLRQAGEVPSLEETVVAHGPTVDATTSWDRFLGRAGSVAAEETRSRAGAIGPDDLCDIMFTSGTTGAPKGAMLCHGATVRAYDSWCEVVGLAEGDRYLVINPFFHSFGLKAGILACLLRGATILPHPVFDVASVMRRVEEEHVSMLPGPPAVYQTILDHPDLGRHDLSSLRLAVTGAAAVPVRMIERMRSELTFRNIVTGYGLTESTGIATMCRHDDDPETIASTAGRAIPEVEVRVVDDEGRDLAEGLPGEVVVRGYNVMKGYYEDPGATASAIDGDGWLHTGDIGVLDHRGNLRITDRKKDMFIVGGFNAYPAEIESTILSNPSVNQVAVVGVPDPRLGEVGMAFVVPRPGAEIDAEELVSWCRGRMANFKVPRYVEVVEELPLNASGKVLKFELRERGRCLVEASA
jgi:acyl-CoA synthetase (AMP-forming)/AMP-acid ligase II